MNVVTKRLLLIVGLCAALIGVAYLFINANTDPRALFIPDKTKSQESYFGVIQGVIAGLIFLFGTIIIAKIKKYKWLAAGILIVLISPVALAGFWFSSGTLGISDWDYYFSYHTELRNMLLVQHTFPFWNPYTCGGTAGLADPEFPVFTPTFLLELIFGIPAGFRLAIFFATAVSGLGMLTLAKKLRLSVYGGLVAALGFAFTTRSLLEIVEGHPNAFANMWVPWILWAWLGVYEKPNRKTAMICGAFFALTFFQGGIFTLTHTLLALTVIILLSKNKLKALLVTAESGLWSVGLAAIKLIPSFFWLAAYSKEEYASSAFTLPWLNRIFLGRFLHGVEDIFPNQGTGWHEYGAYIGPFILVLSIVGLLQLRKRYVIRVLLAGAVLVLLLSSTGPWLKPFFDIANYLPRSNFARIVIYAVISLSLLAGFGIDVIRKSGRWSRFFVPILMGLIAIDLISLTYPLSQQAFVLPAVVPTPPPSEKPISYTLDTFTYRYKGDDYTRAYASIPQGYGTLSYCSVIGPDPAVRAIQLKEDIEYISLDDKSAGSAQLVKWSANKVTVKTNINKQTDVVLNANYAPGWFANGKPAKDNNNRLATRVEPGTNIVAFEYKPKGFMAGLIITITTLLSAVYLGLTVKNFKPEQRPGS